MGHRPFTPAWAEAVKQAVNDSRQFRRAGASWRWPVALVLEAEPALGYGEDRALVLDLDRGRCRSASVQSPSSVSADFVLSGSYGTWKAFAHSRLDPIPALLRGRVRLVRGSLPRLLLHARAARALVRCAASVDTIFPDEAGPDG